MKQLNDDILYRYLNGVATESDYMELNNWLKEKPEHASELFLFEEQFQKGALSRYSDKSWLENAERNLTREISILDKKANRVVRFQYLCKYAAMLAVVIVSIASGIRFWENRDCSDDLIVTVLDSDTIKKVVLPDGTSVWLNKGSQLRYPTAFAKDSRIVTFEGEAYFDVKRDHKRPFIVKNEAMNVKVLGTSFNLNSYKNAILSEVTLIEGEIEVVGNKNEGRIVLAPGQKAELNNKTKHLYVKQVNPDLSAVWHNNLIPFKKASIFEIASVLEKFYDVKIILSPDFNNNTYSGVLRREDSIDQVLGSLKNSIPITFRKTQNNIYLQPKK